MRFIVQLLYGTAECHSCSWRRQRLERGRVRHASRGCANTLQTRGNVTRPWKKHLPDVTTKHATARNPSEVDVDALMTRAGRGGWGGARLREIRFAHRDEKSRPGKRKRLRQKKKRWLYRGRSVTANDTRLRRDTPIKRLIYGGGQFCRVACDAPTAPTGRATGRTTVVKVDTPERSVDVYGWGATKWPTDRRSHAEYR